jgi:putative (di)nucleoside polyphosphate hydrolase
MRRMSPPRQEPPESFRAGAGAVILDREGRVLAFDRADVDGPAWQLPQGGLERGESPERAVWREVEEETGLTRERLELIGRLDEPLAYELPEAWRSGRTGRGQVIYWFFFRLADATPLPPLPRGEFRACRPMDFDELVEAAIDFRQPSYRRLRQHFDAEIRPRLAARR